MKALEITIFATPITRNGIDRFFVRNKSEYHEFLKGYPYETITKREDGYMSFNSKETFELTFPLDFFSLHKYNYASVKTPTPVGFDYHFYFIENLKENNSIGNTTATFYLDIFAEECPTLISKTYNRQFFVDRSHIRYSDYSPRVKDYYSGALVAENVEPVSISNPQLDFDILWYDVEVTRFNRQFWTRPSYSNEGEEWEFREFDGEQRYYAGFSSTYHLFRPYKAYRKCSKVEIENARLIYRHEGAGEETDSILIGGEVSFREVTDNIINISLTFNPPFTVTYSGENDGYNDFYVNAFGSTVADINNTPISSKHFIYQAFGYSVRNYQLTFDMGSLPRLPDTNDTIIDDADLVNFTPLQKLANINCLNIVYNRTVIPIYSEYFTSIIRVNIKEFPTVEGVRIEMTIKDGQNRTLYETNNQPLHLYRVGTIPYSVSQFEAYKIANGYRIKSNLVTSFGNSLLSISNLSPISIARGIISPAQEVAQTLATFADLTNLIDVSGQSGENSMSDIVYQDRLLFTKNVLPSTNTKSYIDFCYNYQSFGADVRRYTNSIFEVYNLLPNFCYIKTVGSNFPVNDENREYINALFDKGVRIWRFRNNNLIREFNTLISNYP